MAAYRKLPSGLWRAEVFKQGVRKSASFATKAAATAWATQVEAEVMARKRGQVIRKSLRSVLDRYSGEVSPTKKNKVWEQRRIRYFCADEFGLPFVDKPADDVSPDDVQDYIRHRLKGVAGSTIDRDLNLLSAVFTSAIEWGHANVNPVSGTKRPPKARPRDRLIAWWEIKRVLRALNWHKIKPVTLQQEAGFAFLMALHTAMRASEVLKAESAQGRCLAGHKERGVQARAAISQGATLVRAVPAVHHHRGQPRCAFPQGQGPRQTLGVYFPRQ